MASTADGACRPTLRIDARGNRTTYTFDANRRPTGRQYPDGSRHTFGFDSVGNRLRMQDGTGTYSYTYDEVSRMHTATTPAGKTITYAFDALGQRSSMIDPDGGRFTYAYDARGLIGYLVNPQGDRTTFAYDAAGRTTVKKLANGTRASFTYDAADRVARLYNLKSDGSVISSFDYAYNNAGNRTSVLEANGDRVTWSYDDLHQLVGEKRSGAHAYQATFTYDEVGNRTVKVLDAARTTFSYDAADQLRTSQDSSGITSYTFDDSGNQQLVVAPSGDRTTNTWDFENQNVKVALPGGTVNTFTYNAAGLRVQVDDSQGTSKIVWDGSQYLAETNESDVTTIVYTNAPGEFTDLISQKDSAKTGWPHFDALGSTRALTDSAENTTDTFLYDANGKELDRTGSTRIAFTWIGRHGYFAETDTGSFYVLRRTYDPPSARWTSFDPIWPQDGLNGHMYVANRPADLTDPSGLIPGLSARRRERIVDWWRDWRVRNAGDEDGCIAVFVGGLGSAVWDKTLGMYIASQALVGSCHYTMVTTWNTIDETVQLEQQIRNRCKQPGCDCVCVVLVGHSLGGDRAIELADWFHAKIAQHCPNATKEISLFTVDAVQRRSPTGVQRFIPFHLPVARGPAVAKLAGWCNYYTNFDPKFHGGPLAQFGAYDTALSNKDRAFTKYLHGREPHGLIDNYLAELPQVQCGACGNARAKTLGQWALDCANSRCGSRCPQIGPNTVPNA